MLKLPHYYLAVLLATLLSFTGCNQSGYQEELESSEAVLYQEPTDTSAITNRKIARTASIRFQVEDLTASSNRVEGLLQQYDAHLVESQQHSSDGSIEANIIIRITPVKLNSFLNELLKESIFLDNKTITAEDITLRYVDVAARIRAKNAVEQRYLELLKQTKNISEILAIEAELNKIREELEVAQARIKEMEKQTAYSTVSLTMYQFVPTSYQDRSNFGSQLVSSLEGGWQLLKTLTVGFFYLWPLWLILPLLIWGTRKAKQLLRRNIA